MRDVEIGNLKVMEVDEEILLEQGGTSGRGDAIRLDVEQQLAVLEVIYRHRRKAKAYSGETHSRAELELDSRHVADCLMRELPKGVGFAVFVFGFGISGNMAYISNANRPDVVNLLVEWLERTMGGTRNEKLLAGQWTPDGIKPDRG